MAVITLKARKGPTGIRADGLDVKTLRQDTSKVGDDILDLDSLHDVKITSASEKI
jgi:hypothetical protein